MTKLTRRLTGVTPKPRLATAAPANTRPARNSFPKSPVRVVPRTVGTATKSRPGR